MLLRHSQYVGLLRQLAMTHKRIQHTAALSRFARIIVAQDPYQRQAEMHELTKVIGRTGKVKPPAGSHVLVAESCVTDYRDNQGDNRQRVRHGAFMVLQQVPSATDNDAIELALDDTEQTAEEIMGAIEHALQGQVKVRITPGSLASESLGPLGDGTWYGTRLDFEFTTPATAALAYKPDAFTF
ncbi:hypothetical protein [Hymenobacter chitinivorans]|uniref:Uncharacterized protein n=1 Tax=Hymenobacter chitinivorans DSM 11115 TaxID=1121954 RepID=A0A2M9BNC5_9BACT|nr:hypothetical protein [Hymenobacter chitinivorans]PJJ59447.1 hypothetical protein CLV45_0864 [Hymenobacter chitinivorans DSM 11115]